MIKSKTLAQQTRNLSTRLFSTTIQVQSSPYEAYNPLNGKLIKKYPFATSSELESALENSHNAFKKYKQTSFSERKQMLLQLADELEKNKQQYAKVMTEEMGKTIVGAVQEVEKCALNCRYYANEGEKMGADRVIDEHSRVAYLPMGPILQIAPFNFPFWQVIRFAAPALMAGNVTLIRHSHCTPNSAAALQHLFDQTNFPKHVYQNVFADNESVAKMIADDRVRGVTFTGSTQTGMKIAEMSAKHLKKHVLELGGSDAFIVLKDADLDSAVETAVTSRVMNAGQSCIAAKRFIVEEAVYDEFVDKYQAAFKKLRIGNPVEKDVQIGPMARKDLRDKLAEQVQNAVRQGARQVYAGKIPQEFKEGFFYPPTVLADVKPDNTAFVEELFGPVAAIIKCKDANHAVELANMSEYGLGSTIFTQDEEKGEWISRELETGMTFVNGICRSSPHLPFGGVKGSGYGRECSELGYLEWCNVKTVWAKHDKPVQQPDDVE